MAKSYQLAKIAPYTGEMLRANLHVPPKPVLPMDFGNSGRLLEELSLGVTGARKIPGRSTLGDLQNINEGLRQSLDSIAAQDAENERASGGPAGRRYSAYTQMLQAQNDAMRNSQSMRFPTEIGEAELNAMLAKHQQAKQDQLDPVTAARRKAMQAVPMTPGNPLYGQSSADWNRRDALAKAIRQAGGASPGTIAEANAATAAAPKEATIIRNADGTLTYSEGLKEAADAYRKRLQVFREGGTPEGNAPTITGKVFDNASKMDALGKRLSAAKEKNDAYKAARKEEMDNRRLTKLNRNPNYVQGQDNMNRAQLMHALTDIVSGKSPGKYPGDLGIDVARQMMGLPPAPTLDPNTTAKIDLERERMQHEQRQMENETRKSEEKTYWDSFDAIKSGNPGANDETVHGILAQRGLKRPGGMAPGAPATPAPQGPGPQQPGISPDPSAIQQGGNQQPSGSTPGPTPFPAPDYYRRAQFDKIFDSGPDAEGALSVTELVDRYGDELLKVYSPGELKAKLQQYDPSWMSGIVSNPVFDWSGEVATRRNRFANAIGETPESMPWIGKMPGNYSPGSDWWKVMFEPGSYFSGLQLAPYVPQAIGHWLKGNSGRNPSNSVGGYAEPGQLGSY